MSNGLELNSVFIDMRGVKKHIRDAVFGTLVGDSNQETPPFRRSFEKDFGRGWSHKHGPTASD